MLEMAGADKSILETIKKRKIGYFGHVLRESKYKHLLINNTEKNRGWTQRTRKETDVLAANIRQWTRLATVQELMRAAENCEI